jgi:hypothetical protein
MVSIKFPSLNHASAINETEMAVKPFPLSLMVGELVATT